MPHQISDNDLLARYLRGDIDARQEAELERRAAGDEDLRAAMEGLRSVPDHDHAASVAAMLAKARAKTEEPIAPPVMKAAPRRLPRYWWAAAAGLLLVIGALYLLPRALDESGPVVAMSEEVETAEPELAPTLEIEPTTPREVPSLAEADDEELQSEPSPPALAPPPPPAPAAAPVAIQRESAPPPVIAEESVPELDDRMVEEVVMETSEIVTEEIEPVPTTSGAPELANTGDELRDRRAASRRSQAQDQATKRQENTSLADRVAGAARDSVAQAPRYLTGIVTDEDGLPIANAEIKLPGLPLGETTDSTGAFQLNYDATLSRFAVTAPGYTGEEIDLQLRGNEPLQITLEREPPLAAADFETGAVTTIDVESITGGRLQPAPAGFAQPAQGFKSLKRSIYDDRPADVPNGRVKVNFLVNPDGTLSDFTFRGQPDPKAADYVKNYLLENGDWEMVRGEEAVRVYFKVRFR